YRFAVLDAPAPSAALEEGLSDVRTWRRRYDTPFAALYFPWLLVRIAGGDGLVRAMPPSGHVTGLYARLDLSMGVHRAPANRELAFVHSVALDLSDADQGVL